MNQLKHFMLSDEGARTALENATWQKITQTAKNGLLAATHAIIDSTIERWRREFTDYAGMVGREVRILEAIVPGLRQRALPNSVR